MRITDEIFRIVRRCWILNGRRSCAIMRRILSFYSIIIIIVVVHRRSEDGEKELKEINSISEMKSWKSIVLNFIGFSSKFFCV